MRPPPLRPLASHLLAWILIALPLSMALFLTSQTQATVFSHDAVVRPTVDGHVTMHTGPFLPDVRADSDSRLGVDIILGKTEAGSTEQLVQRYAFIASQPSGQIARISAAVQELALEAAVRGALLATLPVLIWLAIGRSRRRELLARLTPGSALAIVIVVGTILLGALAVLREPWHEPERLVADDRDWVLLREYVPEVAIPAEAEQLEVLQSATTSGTRRLVLSAIDTYEKSKAFYEEVQLAATSLDLRQPAEGETVAVMVSDRHDNVGMDPVVRAIADRAGATAILDAGDDTSTGQPWEAFSLDSLNDAFDDYEQRFTVDGNHDHGTFVAKHLEDLDWTVASGVPVEGPGGSTLLSWNDPRSSGLGSWRDEFGLSIPEAADQIADVACEAPTRVNTLLVHDADMATAALEQGCVDLALSGHLHVQVGPERIVGLNGEAGYAYTNGTTGGAAYAIAVGSKIRRPAQVTLITYQEGRPVGLQPVTLQTNGVFEVAPYFRLSY